MKKIGIMQPYFFAYIGYFQLIKLVDEYVIYDDVNFIKGGWINRNIILINGKKKYINVLLNEASPNKLINNIYVQDDFIKFMKTITITYSRSPYFHDVYKMLERICSYENKNLARFIGNSIQEILNYLHIETKLLYASELKKDNLLRGQDKVITICKKLGANIYINSAGGQDLYSINDFQRHGIEIKFIKTIFRPYKQFESEFIVGLSIIDALMFNSIIEVNLLLDSYEFI